MSYQPVNGGGGGGDGYGGSTYRDDPHGEGHYDTYRSNDYPMSSNNPYATTSSEPRGYPAKGSSSKKKLWWILGIILAIGIIVGAVVGGVVGSRNSKSSNSTSGKDNAGNPTASDGNTNKDDGSSNNNSNSNVHSATGGAGPTATDSSGRPTGLPTLLSYVNQQTEYKSGSNGNVYLPLATDVYWLPAYATGTQTAGYGAPTTAASPATNGAWPADDSKPSTTQPRAHPRLYAPKYKWDALTNGLIAADPYLSYWNETIIGNASKTLGDPVVPYNIDGGLTGSGVLDVAREIKLKIKNWAYAYKITGQSQYQDRIWKELQHATNADGDFGSGNDIWNCGGHFLDCAEFTNAFAIAFDWLYDNWSKEQRDQIRGWIVDHGLQFGQAAYNGSLQNNWWTGAAPGKGSLINGNWNCVCNAGLLAGSLAIIDDDPSGIAKNLIDNFLIDGAKANCFQGAYSDGTWAETPNYWYFGTTGAAEIVSALETAYGQDIDLNSVNAGFSLTSLYHMYVQGMTSLFDYGDHGPNKFSSTANSLLLWGSYFKEPRYTLYQRDHHDASEPYSMFWYDPSVDGAWWNGLPIDKHFDNKDTEWGTARSSWSDNSGTYWAMKAGKLTGHQTHGDLDIGDFVFDAMGQRWAGDLGSDQYLGYGYFSSEAQDSPRWTYYRKRTEGQNTIMIGRANQLVSAAPTVKFESTGTSQGNMPSLSLDTKDTAYMTIDMSSAYNGATVNRGIRFLNGRTQLLLQDEISGAGSNDIQWRMNTNASVTIDQSDKTTATLELGGQNLTVKILNPSPSGLVFSTVKAEPMDGDPGPAAGGTNDNKNVDMSNDGVTVLVIDNPNGDSMHTEVLFTPQWPGKSDSDYVTPKSVALSSWSLTSHD